ncbi:MAG: hypothetical protein MUO54_06700, partial [Anaerolineales bacterium]|nr:hypothetical protein [Anaerolineales bacterium]
MTGDIIVTKARTNNLKDFSVAIPKNKLVVFSGVSGSGKSSLLFNTIYAEAQRQLIDTFSTFARKRMPKLSRPDVEDIQNLSTAIIIDQKRMGNNLRSTVGTATEINSYLRILFAKFGTPEVGPHYHFSFNHPEGMCSDCKGLGTRITVDLNLLLDKEKSLREGAITHPESKVNGWMWRELIALELFDNDKKLKHFSQEELERLLYSEPFPIEKKHGAGTYTKNYEGFARMLERRITTNAEDAGEKTNAYKQYYIYSNCGSCQGSRLNPRASSVKISGVSLPDLWQLELTEALSFLRQISNKEINSIISKPIALLKSLVEIGVGYLTLDRCVSTLSGGESQRVKMARQLDCTLTDLMYIMDEPTIGLHASDTEKVMEMLHSIKNKGNSVIVVEHNPDVIRAAEWIVDIGPKAGIYGGNLVYSGSPEGLNETQSITGEYV